jgi:hypothetical protein
VIPVPPADPAMKPPQKLLTHVRSAVPVSGAGLPMGARSVPSFAEALRGAPRGQEGIEAGPADHDERSDTERQSESEATALGTAAGLTERLTDSAKQCLFVRYGSGLPEPLGSTGAAGTENLNRHSDPTTIDTSPHETHGRDPRPSTARAALADPRASVLAIATHASPVLPLRLSAMPDYALVAAHPAALLPRRNSRYRLRHDPQRAQEHGEETRRNRATTSRPRTPRSNPSWRPIANQFARCSNLEGAPRSSRANVRQPWPCGRSRIN